MQIVYYTSCPELLKLQAHNITQENEISFNELAWEKESPEVFPTQIFIFHDSFRKIMPFLSFV